MRKIMMTALGMLVSVGVGAQTIYDATNMASKDLNGTARFVGMGGAMGALGGDISTIGTNPAGIGIYRSNDIMTSFGYSSLDTESKYPGKTLGMGRNHWNFDNAGFVLSTKVGNYTSLRYVNFAFNYQKVKSFNRNMTTAGDLGGYSQTYQMAAMTDGLSKDIWDQFNPFDHNDIGWLSALGYDGYLINPNTTTDIPPYTYYTSTLGRDDRPYLREFRSKETGGINQFDFNLSLNFNDRFYLGMTFGAYDVNYNKYTLYDEDFRTPNGEATGAGYELESFNKVTGSGFDVKLGAILRPFEDSPLRLGLAIHTPTFYKLTWATSALLVSDLYNDVDEIVTATVDSYDYLDDEDMNFKYKLNTPWTYNLSLGYTVGSQLALGAEYEYKDYSAMKFQYSDGEKMTWETNEAKIGLKGVSTFRIGAEYKVIPEFALRAGYNYSSPAFKSNAVKALPINSINTDTDYSNLKSLSNYTLGIGYRGSSFYADLAYKYSVQKSDFYPFVNPVMVEDGDEEVWNYVSPEEAKTKVTDSRSQVILTLGFRF
ncbi:OmpP1/FadL family transporter [Bacteroides sp. UBA939]|uniref:OmpP1/FadL family transporter n=1 Tax=Bacteroides sp. UBA939 TaxID=1946092 RepID=UPI0025C1CBAF|nr:outer membrane protein transport protein [Bacteroides sp. UBA939]